MQDVNIGSNSASSKASAPMEGQPEAYGIKRRTIEESNLSHVKSSISAPAFFTPQLRLAAICSVFPVLLQYTIAIFLIFTPILSRLGKNMLMDI